MEGTSRASEPTHVIIQLERARFLRRPVPRREEQVQYVPDEGVLRTTTPVLRTVPQQLFYVAVLRTCFMYGFPRGRPSVQDTGPLKMRSFVEMMLGEWGGLDVPLMATLGWMLETGVA